MSTITIGLPISYPWVLAVASASPFLTIWQMSLVGKARKASGIGYPQMYATKEDETRNAAAARAFNCTQRAHLNTLETYPQFLLTLLIAGMTLPRAAAAFGVVWLIGRIAYTIGYKTGEPKQRLRGGLISYAGLLPLTIAAVYSSFALLQQTQFHF